MAKLPYSGSMLGKIGPVKSGMITRVQREEGFISSNLSFRAATSLAPFANDPVTPWIAAVTTNGGTVSAGTVTAVRTFVSSLQAAGVWSSILRLNLFLGDQLAAAMVPLVRGAGNTIETNSNFVGADYTPTTGLTGDGATKRLDTGLPILSLDRTNFGMGTFIRVAGANAQIGSSYGPSGATDRFYNFQAQQGMGDVTTIPPGWGGAGLQAQETVGSNVATAYANGVLKATTPWNGLGPQLGTVNIFSVGAGFFTPAALSGYYVGNNLNQLALYNAWVTLNTAVGR